MRREWRWWVGPALLSLALALLFLDPFIGDWDAVDYTVLAVRGQPSSMALGRSLFIFFNHGLWLLAHALFQWPAEKAYLLFKYAVVIETPLAILACWRLARELGATVETATLAALLIAVSPAFVLYSGQAMTEIPSVLVLATAITLHARGLRTGHTWMVLAGAALLGAGVNIRESVGFYAPWLALAPFIYTWQAGRREDAMRGEGPGSRWGSSPGFVAGFKRRDVALALSACSVFLVFAISSFAAWFVTDTGQYRSSWNGWRASMAMESALHPVTVWSVIPFLALFVFSAPLVTIPLPFAFLREWRREGLSPMTLLGVVGLFATSVLILNYSTAINWRYFITGLPAFAPLAAKLFLKKKGEKAEVRGQRSEVSCDARRPFRLAAAFVLGISLAGVVLLKPMFDRAVIKRIRTRDYLTVLEKLPADAVVMAGAQTVAVTYWKGLGKGSWDVIGTGGGWPGDQLVSVIDSYLGSGRRVMLDTDASVWSPCGWQRQETEALVKLQGRFRFRRVGESFFEIRPQDDPDAGDAPELERLLPENRGMDMANCLK
jgi:hypothetical protein